jgi:hypothetical protein
VTLGSHRPEISGYNLWPQCSHNPDVVENNGASENNTVAREGPPMLVMALLNFVVGGAIGWRYRVLMLTPLIGLIALEVVVGSLPPRTWMTIAWQGGVLFSFLELGYLAGSICRAYRRQHLAAVGATQELEISTRVAMRARLPRPCD